MKMEPVYADGGQNDEPPSTGEAMPPGTVKVSPEKQQVIGIKVATVTQGHWSETVRVLGRIAPDETRTSGSMPLRMDG